MPEPVLEHDCGMKAVLLVDDDLPLRNSVRELLEKNGATVYEADTSAQALECIAGNSEIGLVLLELDLADDDALVFLAARRKTPDRMPLIVPLTRCSIDEVSRTHFEVFLQKPVMADLLVNLFEMVCGDLDRPVIPPRPKFKGRS